MSDFSDFDRRAMERALELAALGCNTTQPNPRVGCVVARDERIIGEGWHQRAGEPHAEVFALRVAGAAARGATAYVTLEPCNHHGRTPPCSEALIAAGIARVVYSNGDPNPRVDGSGAARLRAAGVRVETGLLGELGAELNLGFFARMRRGRPWLRLKLAASLDGRTALANGESRWISSDSARADVHRFRAASAALLSTSATVIADDPRLDVRGIDVTPPRHPTRIVLDSHLRIRADAQLFATPGDVVLLAVESAVRATSHGERVHVQRLPADATGRVSLRAALEWMGAAGHNDIWTEAGATLAGALLAEQWADEVVLYLAPKFLGPDARPLAQLPALARLADAQVYRVHDLRQIGPDVRIMLRSGG
jgi:diaminohydroxyphosphoribosylaminopyrimidine deaminase/5-amino-6-(5-phosphoribosylamino)uracil reductase